MAAKNDAARWFGFVGRFMANSVGELIRPLGRRYGDGREAPEIQIPIGGLGELPIAMAAVSRSNYLSKHAIRGRPALKL